MANEPKILVLGVTGQVGKLVVQNLKNSPDIEVIAAARNPEKAKDIGRTCSATVAKALSRNFADN
jgi:NAD(P)H dehydrogenase (quinone)